MTSSGSLCWTVDGASPQFLDRVVDISVMLRDMYAQSSTVVRCLLSFLTGAVLGQGCCLPVVFSPVRAVQTVQKTRILQCSSGLVVDMPVGVQTTGPWSDSGENCGSAVAFLRWSSTS